MLAGEPNAYPKKKTKKKVPVSQRSIRQVKHIWVRHSENVIRFDMKPPYQVS